MKKIQPTEAQVEVWLASKTSDQANCAYNECASLRLNGPLDRQRLRAAFDQVCERHEMMRATFDASGESLILHDQVAYAFSEADWSQLDANEREKAREAAISEEGHQPFDLENGPLVRVRLQKITDDNHLLTVTAHHLVIDGWSLWVMARDLGHAYSGKTLPEASSYETYAAAMRAYHESSDGSLDEAFWLEQFVDGIPVLDLPTDRPRPMLKTFSASRCDYTISAELASAIRKAGAKAGCSLFHTMLTGFQAYVARLTAQDDFVLGIPTAGQTAMQLDDTIGHCVNTLPYRAQVDLTQNLIDSAKATRGEVLDMLEHQRYTFGTLLRKLAPPRDPSRPAVFSVMFNVDPAIKSEDLGFDQIAAEVVVEPRAFESFEWFLNGIVTETGEIELQCQFNTDLFDHGTIAGYLEGFAAFMQRFTESPETPLAELPMMSVPQRRKVLVDWNATELEYPVDRCVHEVLESLAAEFAENEAVVYGEHHRTHGDLHRRSNQIARYLNANGVGAGDLVGICVERSHEMLETLLGIWKAGAGYVPLDPAYPIDRLEYMCDQSRLRLVVSQSSLLETARAFGKPVLTIDEASAEIESQDTSVLPRVNSPSDIAYVIYTSGSTGKPKGVQVPHGSVLNFLYAMRDTPGFTAEDSILAVTTLSFDIAVLELYLPLLCGGRVVIADAAITSDGGQLIKAIETRGITQLQATPATWRLLLDADWKGNDRLKALCGGEPMPADLVAPLLDRTGELWNMYGPTETTVWSTCFQITDAEASILVGRPVGNTQIYILDANMQPVAVGAVGEVYIGGAGVTLGYRHRDDLTDERFVDHRWFNPFAEYVSHRIYKTGDLGRYKSDGNIEFLRRNDKQVKVRGYRIELGEIESAIASHPAVARNVVIVREDSPGDTRLVAYTIPQDGQLVTASDLREHIRDSLPHYMIPQHFVELSSFPQTNNGKVDYKALPQPAGASSADEEFVAPETQAELLLAEIWCDLLGADSVSASDNFFNIGGHSLLVMKVIAQVEEETDVRLSPQDFLLNTLAGLAEQLPQQDDELGFGEASEFTEQPAIAASATSVESGGFWGKFFSPLQK